MSGVRWGGVEVGGVEVGGVRLLLIHLQGRAHPVDRVDRGAPGQLGPDLTQLRRLRRHAPKQLLEDAVGFVDVEQVAQVERAGGVGRHSG